MVIGTALLYSATFKYLSGKDYEYIVEIASGGFTVPGLALKAMLLDNKIRYYAVEKDDVALKCLLQFTKSIRLDIKTNNISFNISDLQLIPDKSIICFEHSLEDLLDDYLGGLKETAGNEHGLAIANNFISMLLDEIIVCVSRSKICTIIHHFIKPEYNGNSNIADLDRLVISILKQFVITHAQEVRVLSFDCNYKDELFLCIGGRIWD